MGSSTLLLVVGMHRSGTSAVTRVLNLLGASLGDESTLISAKPDNPRGFWESLEATTLNDRLLAAVGGAWDRPVAISADWVRTAQAAPFLAEARELLRRLRADGAPMHAIKDPRFCLTLPFWRSVEPDLRIVMPMRDPLAVAQSLARRNQFDLSQGAQLWSTYVDAALGEMLDPIVVDYQQLMDAPRSTSAALADAVGLPPPGKDVLTRVDDFLEPELDHGDPGGGRFDPVVRVARRRYYAVLDSYDVVGGVQAPRLTATKEMPSGDRRTVLVHYHLPQNAGSALDATLMELFPGRWVSTEFPSSEASADAVAAWIAAEPDAIAFSSDTMELPPPELPDAAVVPLVFVRHPIDRIASVFHVEQRQGAAGRSASLREYVERRRDRPDDRQCRNFQVSRLARLYPTSSGTELERALRAVEELPFVGVVEDYDRSLRVLGRLLRTVGLPDGELADLRRAVRSDRSESLSARLADIEADLGREPYRALLDANSEDLLLHRAALARLTAQAGRAPRSPTPPLVGSAAVGAGG